MGTAVLALHRLDDVFNRGRIVPVAGKQFVAQRQALTTDHQRNVDLLAVAAMIARVAALRSADLNGAILLYCLRELASESPSD
jgi:hypothetical protein